MAVVMALCLAGTALCAPEVVAEVVKNQSCLQTVLVMERASAGVRMTVAVTEL